ncbi:MAG: MATE family efflux transporter [Oscillospiraceae bacterium]|nr:MATE family efflux transporter [Oscillospiraceae bacterium]
MVRDMTSGSPMKLIVGFAVPIFLGNLFQQLYSVVDAMVLGRAVGADALAAAGSTQALSFLVLGFITGLTHGYAILIAQRFGAGDYAGVRRTAANAGYLAAVSSLIITAASLLGARALLEVMHTPEDIFRDALLYIQVIFIGTAASVAYNMFSGILRALGDSVSPLVILVVSSIVNVGLDVLFVVVFQWGVAGAAWATVLAQALSSAMCFAVLRRLELMRFQREDWRGDRDVIRALLRLGVPVGIMNSITAMGIMILQSVVNGLGSVTVAAYTAGSKLMNLALQPGDILGIAVGTYVGQNLGAGRLDRIRAGVRQSVLLSLAINIVMGLVLALFGRELTAVFVSGTEEAVIEAAYPYFVITGAGVWIVGLLFLYRFALQSLGDTFIPMVSGGVELGMRVGAVLVLDRCFDMGFYAVCWAEVAAWLGAGVLLAVGYYARMARLSRQEQ